MNLLSEYPVELTAKIDIQPVVDAAVFHAEMTNQDTTRVLDQLQALLGAREHIDEICISHCSWITVELNTSDARLAGQRVAKVQRMLRGDTKRLLQATA